MVKRKRRFGLARETHIMEKAAQRKMNRYTSSGLIVILIGLVVIFAGFSLHMGAYSPEGLVIGIGAITVIVGIIRILIGLINPSSPADLHYVIGDPLPATIIESEGEGDAGDGSAKSSEAISLDELTYHPPRDEE